MTLGETPAAYWQIGGILLLALFTGASCGDDSAHIDSPASYPEAVQIHAGAKGGSYAALVNQVNLRAASLREACAEKRESVECLLASFEFSSACSNGGSLNNLQRLGMPQAGPPASFQKKVRNLVAKRSPAGNRQVVEKASCETANGEQRTGFGLVQNFFVYGAAAKSCSDKSSDGCKSKAAKEDLKTFAYFEDLRTVLPISYGRVQIIVAADKNGVASINMLQQLGGQKIYLGNGVNAVHGKEVFLRHPRVARNLEQNTLSRDEALDALAAKTGMERDTLPTGQKDLGNLLLACDIVKAYVISGELINEVQLGDHETGGCPAISLKQVQIPAVIINGMVSEFPYYQRVPAPPTLQQTGFAHPMPAVTTYLVTTKSTPTTVVRRLTRAMQADWRNLMLLNDDLVPLEENIYKQPAPLHAGALEALQDAGLLGKDLLPWYWALAGVVTLFAFFWTTEISYDRLGEKRSQSSGRHFSRMILILFGTLMFFLLVVKLIRQLEGAQATDYGTDNPIAHKGFEEVLLWMFTFVSSGYENNVFPSSPYSIFVVGVFAIFGIALPIWAIVKVVDHMREAKLARDRGGETRSWLKQKKDRAGDSMHLGYRSKGVLLLCGWNNKAPGLVYTMTCPDSPYPGIVNIIADMDVEYPIQHWRFNKKRVRFYRGDASHRSTLERADGLRADNALILADFNAGSTANTAGMLTALAINKLREKRKTRPLRVSAEMSLKKDDLRFLKAHVNNIVDAELIAERMIAVACFNRYVLNFILDALSPDDRCEWYSVPSELFRKQASNGRKVPTIGDYQQALQKRDIVLIGVCSEETAESEGNFSPDFNKDDNLNPLREHQDLQLPVAPGSYLVCAALNPSAFKKQGFLSDGLGLFRRSSTIIETRDEATSILSPVPADSSVLIIGHKANAASLENYIASTFGKMTFGIVTTDTGSSALLDEQIVNMISTRLWTHVILLSNIPESHDETEYSRYSKHADSETILRANLIKTALAEKNTDAIIVAELHNPHSRRMAEDAGVTTVVSSALLVQRILARLISGRGHVSEMLMAMLSMKDGIYLRSIELHAGHPLIGRTFVQTINTWFADGRVMGLLPHESRKFYENESEDFGTHFAMCPTVAERDLVLAEKDVLVVLSRSPAPSPQPE